jgi:hypothetical protein
MSRPFIPVPNCASVEMIYSSSGVICENVLHVQKGSPYSLTDLQAVRAIVNTWDGATWSNRRSSTTVLQRIRTKALDTNASPVEDYSLPTPRGGAVGTPPLPGNATYCIKMSTGLTGRSQRGRLYFIGMTDVVLGTTHNQVVAAFATDLVANLTTLMTNLATGGHTLGVVSYRHDLEWRSVGQFTPATGWVAVDLNTDSQRRRLT